MSKRRIVLDATAILALLFRESGSERVAHYRAWSNVDIGIEIIVIR